MLHTNGRNKLPFTDGSWAVAELQVSYEPKNSTGVILQSSYQCYQVFSSMWDRSLISLQEQFCVLFLNQKYEVIGFRIINTGKTSSTTVDINFIATCALVCRARGVVIAHNHPSGRYRPSHEDMELTRAIIDRLMLFEITVVDHLIITRSGYFSFADSDLIIKNE